MTTPNVHLGSLPQPASMPASKPASEQGDTATATGKTKEELLQEQLAFLEQLDKENEALKQAKEGKENGEVPPQMPEIDAQAILAQRPFNPDVLETYDGTGPLFNIAKLILGPSALQFKFLAPTMGALGTFLSMSNRDILPGVLGLGITCASTYFLNSSVQQLFVTKSQPKTNMQWLASKTLDVAKVGLAGYAVVSGVGMLAGAFAAGEACAGVCAGAKAFGLLSSAVSIASGLYSMYTSAPETEAKADSKGGWAMFKSAAKVGAVAYGAVAGTASWLGLGNLPGIELGGRALSALTPYAWHGTKVFELLANFIVQKPIEMALAIGLTIGTQLLMWKIVGSVNQQLSSEVEKITNSNKYGPVYEMLESISQEQYQNIMTKETGMNYDDIKGAFEPLRSRNPNHPENVVKPIVAKLIVVNKEVFGEGGLMQKYVQLRESNDLQGAYELLNKEIRKRLMLIVYFKHCIIDPQRPQFGQVFGQAATQEYFSLVSQLVGQPIKLPLEQVDPTKIQEEAHMIMLKENEAQTQYYLLKAMHEKAQKEAATAT